MPRVSSPAGLPDLLDRQLSLASRSQLLHLGMKDNVLVPTERQRMSTGFVKLHRTTRMPSQTCSAGPVRLALVPRAVADTARLLVDYRDVRAVVAEAVQLGRRTPRELAQELSGSPVRGSAMFRQARAASRSRALNARLKPRSPHQNHPVQWLEQPTD